MPPPQPLHSSARARLAWRARVAWSHEPALGQPDAASTLEFVAIRQRFLKQARELVDDQHHDAAAAPGARRPGRRERDEPASPASPPPAAQRMPAAHSSRVYAFNFHEYLYMRMAGVLSEFVELPPSLWGCLAVVLAAMITVYKVVPWKRSAAAARRLRVRSAAALYATILKLHAIRRACMDARVVHTVDIVTEKYSS